jgi:hypothetical protein
MDKNAKYDAYIIGVFVASPFILFILFLFVIFIESRNRIPYGMPQAIQLKTIELEGRDYVISADWWFYEENILLFAKNKSDEKRFLGSYNGVRGDTVAFFKIKKDTANILFYGNPDTFHVFLPKKFESIKIAEGFDK